MILIPISCNLSIIYYESNKRKQCLHMFPFSFSFHSLFYLSVIVTAVTYTNYTTNVLKYNIWLNKKRWQSDVWCCVASLTWPIALKFLINLDSPWPLQDCQRNLQQIRNIIKIIEYFLLINIYFSFNLHVI